MPDESALENQEQSTPKPESPRAISAESSARTSPRASESFRRLTRFLGNYAEVKEKGVRRALGVEDRRESGKLIDSSSNTEPAPTSTKETPFPEKLSATDRLRRFVRNYLTVKREESLRKKFGLPEESIGTEGERLSKKYGWSKESNKPDNGDLTPATSPDVEEIDNNTARTQSYKALQEHNNLVSTANKESSEPDKSNPDYLRMRDLALYVINERVIKSIHAEPLTPAQLEEMEKFSMIINFKDVKTGKKWQFVYDKIPLKDQKVQIIAEDEFGTTAESPKRENNLARTGEPRITLIHPPTRDDHLMRFVPSGIYTHYFFSGATNFERLDNSRTYDPPSYDRAYKYSRDNSLTALSDSLSPEKAKVISYKIKLPKHSAITTPTTSEVK